MPVDGVIEIDANGVAEVSPKCAAALVRGTNDWDYVKKNSAEETEEEEKDEEEEGGEEEISDRDKFSKWLDSQTVAQMKEYAKEGELPEEEWGKLSPKKLMKAYLLKKYDEASVEEGEE